METIHEEKYKGLAIKIYQDSDPESPRAWDNLGRMVCFHGRYALGDKTELTSDMFSRWEELEDYLVKKEMAIVVLPLYLYDHSGLRMKVGSFSGLLPQGHAEFDSGQVGFIYVDEESIKKNFGVKRIGKRIVERTKKVLLGEVEDYDDYLVGNVYGFVIEDDEEKELGSCWGFLGDYEEGALKEARENADGIAEDRRKKQQARLKSLIKNRVPLRYR